MRFRIPKSLVRLSTTLRLLFLTSIDRLLSPRAALARLFYHTALCILGQTHPDESGQISEDLAFMQRHHARQACGIAGHTTDKGIASVSAPLIATIAPVLEEENEQMEVLLILKRSSKTTHWCDVDLEKKLQRGWAWQQPRQTELRQPRTSSPETSSHFRICMTGEAERRPTDTEDCYVDTPSFLRLKWPEPSQRAKVFGDPYCGRCA